MAWLNKLMEGLVAFRTAELTVSVPAWLATSSEAPRPVVLKPPCLGTLANCRCFRNAL